jgi:hypothetical protein
VCTSPFHSGAERRGHADFVELDFVRRGQSFKLYDDQDIPKYAFFKRSYLPWPLNSLLQPVNFFNHPIMDGFHRKKDSGKQKTRAAQETLFSELSVNLFRAERHSDPILLPIIGGASKQKNVSGVAFKKRVSVADLSEVAIPRSESAPGVVCIPQLGAEPPQTNRRLGGWNKPQ